MDKEKNKRVIKEYALITIGSFITALGLVLFMTPSKIAAGGVSGIAVIFYHLFGFDPGYSILILSLPIFLIGLKIFGRRYGFKSLYGTIALSVGVSVFGFFLGYDGVLAYADRTDVLLSALFGGVIIGGGLGIVMKGGANTGGTDILAQILHRYSPLPLGTSLFIVDGAVIAASAVVFGIEAALFAVIAVFATGQVINLITSGANYAKMAYIISSKHEEIRGKLLHDMGLGGTLIDSRGMYTDMEKNLIMTVVRNRKISQVTNVVRTIDPNAFMVITNAAEVLGEGFIPIESYKRKF
ncbi:MAG: YitT family protein [Bacteroidetes bacterium]|nr:YitT family protein [Bacteroidota bacterium]